MKKPKIWIWWVIAAIAAVIVLFFFIKRGNQTVLPYKTVKIEKGDMSLMVSSTGTLAAVTSVDVGSQVSGIIKNIYVDFNSSVKKGEVIAQIDPVSYKAKLDQADASLSKAKNDLESAKLTLDRDVELLSQNFIAQSEKDAAQTAYKNALAALKQAQASYNLALADYNNTTITSPITGVVMSINISEGQTVAASLSAPTLFVIAKDLKQMQVEANIDEGDIGSIEIGQEVNFTVDAFPDKKFSGRVRQVRFSPTTTNNVVTYPVIINVVNDKFLLKPGMTATIDIVTAKASNVMKVSNTALKFNPFTSSAIKNEGIKNNGKETFTEILPFMAKTDGSEDKSMGKIWVLEDGKLKPIDVKTGITDGITTEIHSDELKEGQEAVTGVNAQAVKTSAATTSSPFGMQPPSGNKKMGPPPRD